jgi:hypothetical protein
LICYEVNLFDLFCFVDVEAKVDVDGEDAADVDVDGV